MSDHDELAHLPRPSVWPFAVGAGVTLLALGLVTSLLLSLLGLVLVAYGLGGWIGTLRDE